MNDNVKHPSHYTSHPSGIECIAIVKHHEFTIGNAIKYLWRAGLKKPSVKHEDLNNSIMINKEIEDLEKAIEYINYKIDMLRSEAGSGPAPHSF